MFSKSCKYGLRAMIFITQQTIKGKKIGVSKIAEAIGSPEAYTGKVLQKLVKNNLISSVKGPYGGFKVEKNEAKKTSLEQTIKAFDGDDVYLGCGLGLSECSDEQPCPLHQKFAPIREKLIKLLEENTVFDLAINENGIETVLKLK